MNLLHWFFNKINPEGAANWLSAKYAWWYYSRKEKYNREFMANPHVPIESFDVAGAGNVCISKDPCHFTGSAYGFGFSVSWGSSLYIGGVLGLEEAKRMAEFILEKYNEQTKSEAELIAESWVRVNNNP